MAASAGGTWLMRLLLQMQQAGIEPTERTFIGAIRAGARARRRGVCECPPTPAREGRATRGRGAWRARSRRAGAPCTKVGDHLRLDPRVRRGRRRQGGRWRAGGARGKHIAEGTPPDARMFAAATASCAKAPGQWRDAFQIVSMMELWVREERVPKPADRIMRQAHIMYPRAQEEAIGFAYALAVAACDKSGNMDAALEILPRMEELCAAAQRCIRVGDLGVQARQA